MKFEGDQIEGNRVTRHKSPTVIFEMKFSKEGTATLFDQLPPRNSSARRGQLNQDTKRKYKTMLLTLDSSASSSVASSAFVGLLLSQLDKLCRTLFPVSPESNLDSLLKPFLL